MKKKQFVILLILIVLILGAGVAYFGYTIQQNIQATTQKLTAPIDAITNGVATQAQQIAQILNPTPTIVPDPESIIHEVRSLARLETSYYSVEKIVTGEMNTDTALLDFFLGQKLLFIAHGYVIAGVDLEKLEPQDLSIKEGVLYVTLPEAEIFVATLDNDKSYVYDRQSGVLTDVDQNLETHVRQVAQQAILDTAIEDGILEQAQTNAEIYLLRLFIQAGFYDVIFE